MHLNERLSHITLGSGGILVAQILCYLSLLWFLGRSLWILVHDLRQKAELKNGQVYDKAFPALSILYMVFSTVFISFLISDFDEIISIFIKGYEMDYKIVHGVESLDLELSPVQQSNLEMINFVLTGCFCCILSIFAINFSKAFSTLNSLELGLLGSHKVEKLCEGRSRRKFCERLLRTFIAFFFIILEKELYEFRYFNDTGNLIDPYLVKFQFSLLSKGIIILYLLLLTWFFLIIRPLVLKNKDFKWFRRLTPSQLIAGCCMGLSLLLISTACAANHNKWTMWAIACSSVIGAGTIIFIISILCLEYMYAKNVLFKLNASHS